MSQTNPCNFSLSSTRLKRSQLREAEAALLSIDGMVCSVCALNVLGVLFALDGVFVTEVLWQQGKATVAYNPALVQSKQLTEAVATAGGGQWRYRAHVLSTLPVHDVLTV
jgi:copper chaperone CopZ